MNRLRRIRHRLLHVEAEPLPVRINGELVRLRTYKTRWSRIR